MSLETLTFPRTRLAEGLLAVVRQSRWPGGTVPLDVLEDEPRAGREEQGLASFAARIGVEAQPVQLSHGELTEFLTRTGPALLRPVGEPDRLVAIAGGGRRWCRLAAERSRRVRTDELRDFLTRESRRSAIEAASVLLEPAAMSPDRLEDACRALADEQLSEAPAVEGWLLEPLPGTPFAAQLRASGATEKIAMILACRALATLLLIASWWMIGRGALEGELDRGWLGAWVLLLMTTIPLRAAERLSSGHLAWTAGALLKRRLLYGALRLEPDEVRGQGAGEWLGRVIDSERVEVLAMNGGLSSLLAGLELLLAATVLLAGATPAAHLILLAAWLILLAVAARSYLRRRRSWTWLRIGMTHRLVERLVGHRTRVAQEPRASWHDAEDRELESYARESADLDRWLPRLQVLVTRGWMISALVALIPGAFADALEPAPLAVSLGGILLAFGALRTMVASVAELGAAGIAWRQVEPLFEAATRPTQLGSPVAQAEADGTADRLLEATDVSYRHVGRERDAVHDCSLDISTRDRILLQGPSGSGKSTLIALLAGLRPPRRGWLGLRGLDLDVWGEDAWRRQVICVPQFHDNHLVTAPLAFNLLMGRRWPPTARDLDDAQTVCVELGLGPLLDRMPAGLMQPVGDSGWQLSHGERTRVFLARALLGDAELVILDESFAGLDYDNLERAVACVEDRAPTLLVIAHP